MRWNPSLQFTIFKKRSGTSVAVHFTTERFTDKRDQLRYTVALIHKIAQYYKAVQNETLPVQYTRRGEALCMLQFPKLLATYRVPHVDGDYLFQNQEPSQHVIIAHNNHFFKLPVYEGNKLCDATTLLEQLVYILNNSTKAPESVGILTTLERDVWAERYNDLIQNTTNARNIDSIKKSICLISLDQTHFEKQQNDMCNRWFDKTCQFVVNGNGVIGLCLEHSSVDGSTADQMIASLSDMKWKNPDCQITTTKTTTSRVGKLSWVLDDQVLKKIRLAKNQLNRYDLEIHEFLFEEFGKAVVKRLNVSPDAFFQAVIQLAYYRLHKRHVSTGETAHLRKFVHGRLNNFPSATSEICLFARSMDQKDISDKSKQQMLAQAIHRHAQITQQASNGPHEMHLISLSLMANELNIPTLEIFTDASYSLHIAYILSTSQLSSVKRKPAIFAPYMRSGYSISYNMMPDQFVYVVSSYKSYTNTNAEKLGEMIGQALNDILLLMNV